MRSEVEGGIDIREIAPLRCARRGEILVTDDT